MRAVGCLFTSSTLPGILSFPDVLVENFQLLQTKSKSAETGSGWTILTRTWAWWWRWSPSPATRRRSRSERWSPRTRRTCSWTSVGPRGARARRGPRTGRAARSTTLEPPSAACGRSPSTLRSSAGTGCSSQGESEHTWTCWPGVAGRTRQTSALGVVSWEHPRNTLMAPSHRWLSNQFWLLLLDHGHPQMAGLHSTAGPCCSPRKMAPINMLYLDQVTHYKTVKYQ